MAMSSWAESVKHVFAACARQTERLVAAADASGFDVLFLLHDLKRVPAGQHGRVVAVAPHLQAEDVIGVCLSALLRIFRQIPSQQWYAAPQKGFGRSPVTRIGLAPAPAGELAVLCDERGTLGCVLLQPGQGVELARCLGMTRTQ